jgi:predicted phage gp36 major capsid-like protein
MGEEPGQVSASVENEQKTPEELRREIEATRRDLGDTAAALAEKTDIRARAKEKLDDVKRRIADKRQSLAQSGGGGEGTAGRAAAAGRAATQAKAKAWENPVATAALAAFAVGFVLGRITSS